MLNPNLPSDLLTPAIQALTRTHSYGKKSVENTSWKTILSHLRRGNWPIRELLALHCDLWPEYNMQIHILFALAVNKYCLSF